jgi:hypothetical protein
MRTLAHDAQSDMGIAGIMSRIETDTIVGDTQPAAIAANQQDIDLARPGMFAGIGKGLLHDVHDLKHMLRRQLGQSPVALETSLDAGLTLEFIKRGTQCCFQIGIADTGDSRTSS